MSRDCAPCPAPDGSRCRPLVPLRPHERSAGFYLCWGCLVWVPFLYTIHAFWLVLHPVSLGVPLAATILTVGWTCIFVNYDADRQRAYFRKTAGKARIWGSLPGTPPERARCAMARGRALTRGCCMHAPRASPDKIVATYKTLDGKKKSNLLLVSGWWAMSRHFHYLPELGAAFCWSVPAQFTHVMPYVHRVSGLLRRAGVNHAPHCTRRYFYFMFLLPLLLDRAFRDEQRCSLKYGAAWQEYVSRVPARIVPGIF